MPPIVRPANAISPEILNRERLHALPLLRRRLNGCLVPVHGVFEGFDLLPDLGVDATADRNRGIEVGDRVGLVIEPGMNDGPALVGVLLFFLQVLTYPFHPLLDAAEDAKDIVIRSH
jgi:hypothetical protein